jgi:integrase
MTDPPRLITERELYAFRENTPAVVQIAIDLCLLSRLTLPALLTLRWDHIDVNEMILYTRRMIGGKPWRVALPIDSDAFEEVLVRAKRMRPALPRAYVLRNRVGTRYYVSTFNAVWNHHMHKHLRSSSVHERFGFDSVRLLALSRPIMQRRKKGH